MTTDQMKGRFHMSEGTITEGQTLTGVMFNEPMRVLTTRQSGTGTVTAGLVGQSSGQFREVTITAEDIVQINAIDLNASYDGDGELLKLALQACTLGIAHEFDPYFGLSISRVDPLPHQLEAVYEYFWVIQDVDYLETVVRRERQGTSHGLSIRVARGLYHRPSTFRSRPIEWEETVHADTGMLGLTTKHVHFAGSRKRFRVRYDKIVAFEPFSDGSGIMRDAQTAKPQTFRAGDGWFAYNRATNLAQL